MEALHGHENRKRDEKSQADFAAKRAEALDVLKEAGIPSKTLRFLKEKWSTRRPDSLDRRLLALITALSAEVSNALLTSGMRTIETELIAAGAKTLPAQLRMVRNNLSHGTRNYPDRDLRPWVSAAETLCRAHALRLLGFDAPSITHGLTGSPPPNEPAGGASRSA